MNLITIMICTYKRTKKLKATLDSILNLDFDLQSICIIVVDNDEQGTGKNVVEEYKEKINIIYDIEVERGISNARNRCISIARKINSDFVAFIDDDEIVCKNWLKELIKIMNIKEADIVSGPVYRIYPEETPKWILKTGIFEPVDMNDGIRLDKCASGNVLMKKELIYDMEFDSKYGLTGGEDTKFFMELNKKGKKIVYSKYSIAYESLEYERLNYIYVAKRLFREASYYVKIEKEILKEKFIKRLLKALCKIVISIIIIPLSIFGGLKQVAKNISRIIRGCGEIYGLFSKNIIKGY